MSDILAEVMKPQSKSTIKPGKCFPLGATVSADGVNFSIFSKSATRVDLLLFDQANDDKPVRVIKLRPSRNRTFYYWHVFVPDLEAGQLYAYRVHGPFNLQRATVLRLTKYSSILMAKGLRFQRISAGSLPVSREIMRLRR